MSRTRISTTVDEELLRRAREGRATTDAKLVDAALRALLASERAAEIDASYRAYDVQPLDVPDAWGDVESWRHAAGAS